MENAVIHLAKKAIKTSAIIRSEHPVLRRWKRMEIILKVTERCNINCTYCYFFNSTNQDYNSHPVYIHEQTIESVGKFLRQAVLASDTKIVQIDFHGGEPLMMKKARFKEMCLLLKKHLDDVVKLKFVMQTNAMLIDDEWIGIFAEYEISIGISLDGPQRIHDATRIDHQGGGTYSATVNGLNKIRLANIPGLVNDVGIICVINPDTDAKEIFNHFVNDLGLNTIHYLLPMADHDGFDSAINEKMRKYICDLFDAWTKKTESRINIRYLQRLWGLLLGGEEGITKARATMHDNMAITIASNGDIGLADDLRNSLPWLFWTGKNVSTTSLHDFLALPEIEGHFQEIKARHPDCQKCCWGNLCDGGDFIGSEAFRYSKESGFGNKSIYCQAIQGVYSHMTKATIEMGVPFARIDEVLIKDFQ